MKKVTHQKMSPLDDNILLYKQTTWYLLGLIPVFSSTLIEDK